MEKSLKPKLDEHGYEDRANLENVWKQYHALGGNGDMNDLRNTFRHLPTVKGGEPVVTNDGRGV